MNKSQNQERFPEFFSAIKCFCRPYLLLLVKTVPFRPMKWKSGFRNTGKFCLWNPDYTAQGIRNPTNDWNPRIQVLLTKTGIQFLESRIQDCPGILYTGRYYKHPNSKIVSTFKVLSPDSKRSLKNKFLCKLSKW